ncbi:MAG: AhpC/TSA family protein [Bacteroidetes bacterium]|nr:AhpC/TSA family protein [Bacteroidota bacterium]
MSLEEVKGTVRTMRSLPMILIVLAAVLISSCGGKTEATGGASRGDSFVINGNVMNAPTTNVILQEITSKAYIDIDTAEVESNGAFKLEGSVSEKGFYRLLFSNNTNLLLVLDNRKIEIEYDVNDPSTLIVEGSSETLLLQDLVAQVTKTGQQLKALQIKSGQPANSTVKAEIQRSILLLVGRQKVIMTTYIDSSTTLVGLFAANVLAGSYSSTANDMDYLESLIPVFRQRFPGSDLVAQFDSQITELVAYHRQRLQAEQNKPEIGTEAANIIMSDPNGNIIELTSLRGNYVLLDFWAAWCRPCRAENPNLVNVYNKYKDKGFTIYSVSLDSKKAAWQKAISDDGLTWDTHVSDLKGWGNSAAVLYSVGSIPASFLLDKEGTIIATNLRGPALEAKISELLN